MAEICHNCVQVINESMEKFSGEPEPIHSQRVRRMVDIFANDLDCHGSICQVLLQEVAKGNGYHVMPRKTETTNPYIAETD